jgi:hypothetical protein
MPLGAIIACVILSALFFFAYGVAREPRNWRRLYQHYRHSAEPHNVNKNKALDERIGRQASVVAVVILVIDILVLLGGVGYAAYERYQNIDEDTRARQEEVRKLNSTRTDL